MKKIIYTCLLFVCSICFVNAASLGVSANKSTVVVGSTVNVTVTASGGAGWEYCLNYDESLFQLTSAGTDTGGKCLKTGSTMTGYSKVTFTLKAKKSGSGTVSLTGAAMYGDDGLAINSSKGSVNLVAKTQAEIEASYSTNANLKSLSVKDYEISPAFDKDTLEYSLEVENDIETVTISALRADGNALVSGTGEVTLTEGANVFNIVVTAQKGNKKTYVLTINRKELNPIEVNVDGKKLFVVRRITDLEVPTYYVSSTENYEYADLADGDNSIPVFKSEISGYTLVALKDEEGNVNFYIWNKEDNSFRLYQELNSSNLMIVIEQPEKLLEGFDIKKNYKINGKDIEVYKDNGNSKFGLIYGMNAATGNKGWYQVDLEEGTYQRYNEELFNNVLKEQDKYKMFCLYAVIGCGLLLLVVFILLISKSRLKKKNKKMYAILSNGGHVSSNVESVDESVSVDEEDVEETTEDEETEEEIEEEPKKEEKKKQKREKKSRGRKKKEVIEEEEPSEEEEVSEEVEETSEDEEKSPELKEVEEEEKQELSKKELRRLEKEKIKKEREELKKMQDEFLN